VPCRINDCAIGEGAQIYLDRGDVESNIEDDTLSVSHALPLISPYGHGKVKTINKIFHIISFINLLSNNFFITCLFKVSSM